jgi:hypothetical protein
MSEFYKGIPEDKILEWKCKYGLIYQAAHRGTSYVFRGITYAEYDEAVRLGDYKSSAEQEDYLVSTALLWPKKTIDEIPSGFVTSLSALILNYSGFSTPAKAIEILQERRNKTQSVRNTVYALVLDAMPAYKKEDLDNFNFLQICDLAILAEQIIKIRQAYNTPGAEVTFEIIDVEKERKETAEKEQRKFEAMKASAERMGKSVDDIRYSPTVKPDDPIAARLRAALG